MSQGGNTWDRISCCIFLFVCLNIYMLTYIHDGRLQYVHIRYNLTNESRVIVITSGKLSD